MKALRLTDSITYHGEGACWWSATGRLRLVDMLAGAVLELDDGGAATRMPVGSPVAAVVRPREGGGAVVATEHGISLARREDLADLAPAATVLTDQAIRLNEGGCDPRGRFWIGSMAYAQTPGAAEVFCWDGPGTEPVRAWGGATICNGLGWSPDGSRAYWIDTPTGVVTVLDDDPDRGLVDPRPFATIDPEVGHPDGLCVDAEGGVWVALYGGSQVQRFDDAGRLSAVVELPVGRVTSVTLGGPALDRLYITTSRENLPEGAEPEAGSVFVAEPGVRGMEPLPFRG